MAAGTLEHAFSYVQASQAVLDDRGLGLALATSGGIAAHPRLFTGDLPSPALQATALLTVARCARAQFFDHARPMADPVVTAHADRLRFEALSSCASVYVRHDVDLSGADGEVVRVGVTNVDVNADTRAVLARVAAGSRLHLDVGDDGVTVTTGGGVAVERRVPLPVRWVKGFGEVGVAQRALQPAFELSGAHAERFLRRLPTAGRALHVVPGTREPRWSASPGRGSVEVNGPERLKLLEPLARHTQRLAVFAGPGGVSAWELDTGAGRLHLVLSPAPARGFSGEGATLASLAAEAAGPVADALELELAWQPRLDPTGLAARTGCDVQAVDGALGLLAARGRAGYDLEDGAFFHRDLPYDLASVEALHPRLRDARALLAAGDVRLEVGGRVAWARGTGTEHRIRLDEEPPACSCAWWARHRGARGPCKHVLAAQMLVSDGRE